MFTQNNIAFESLKAQKMFMALESTYKNFDSALYDGNYLTEKNVFELWEEQNGGKDVCLVPQYRFEKWI